MYQKVIHLINASIKFKLKKDSSAQFQVQFKKSLYIFIYHITILYYIYMIFFFLMEVLIYPAGQFGMRCSVLEILAV